MKNKKIHSYITTLFKGVSLSVILIFSLIWVFTSSVSAAGGRDETGEAIGGLCYKQTGTSRYPMYITQPSDRETCEVGLQGEVIDPGETVPAPVCVNNNRTRGYDSDYTPEKCIEDGGVPLNQGQELPKYYASDDRSFKNSQNNLNTPESLTNDEREALKNCDGTNDDAANSINEAKLQDCLNDNPIIRYVLMAINVLSAGVGIVVVIMITIGGIQYASAGGDPSKVKAAKTRITNAITALIAYFFLFAFLQWLVPGGFF